MFRSLVILGFLFFNLSSLAQDDKSSHLNKYNQNKLFKVKSKTISTSDFFDIHKTELGIGENNSFKIIKSFEIKSNSTVIKYKQYYKSLEVVGGNYILHMRNNILEKATGNLLPYLEISIKPSLSFDDIKTNISDQLQTSMIKYDYWANLDEIQVDYKNKGLKIIDAAYPNFSGNYQLAYKVAAITQDDLPFDEDIYINANTGKLINHFSNIHVHNVPGVVKTKYYGEQNVTIDSLNPNDYYLRDLSRGDGVITLNNELSVFRNNSNYWDLENEEQDEVACDLHYCASSFYDLMYDHFGWSGIDGEGSELVTVAHVGGKFLVNAFWDGTRARFGNGDCDRYQPLTTLDIVGHEFAHGLTDHTSDLIYRNESGALNESMSDIFGKALEYYYDNENFNWLIGDRIRLNEDVNVIRSMSNPIERNDPKFYKGEFWWTSTGDNGGVHSNSGVLNHWFYLLVNGGMGVNEIGEDYNISALSFDDALQIVFNMQRSYLTENSNYYDALIAAVESAKDLFGEEIYPSFTLINQGRTSILKGTKLIARFTSNNNIDAFSEEITLNTDFEVGDSFSYMFNSPFTNELVNNGSFTVSIALLENQDNLLVEAQGNFGTSETNGKDILLDDFQIFNNDKCSVGPPDAFRYTIRNMGCETILNLDSIYFDVETNAGDFRIGVRTLFDFEPGTSITSTRIILFSTNDRIPQGIETFIVNALYVGDVVEDNNSFSGEVEEKIIVSNGYHETFSDVDAEKAYEIVRNTFYTGDTILNYRNNNMLGILGLRDHSFFRNCEKEEDFFSEYFFKADIEYCIDASQIENPIFEFNVMMFNHEESVADLINQDYNTMVRVNYENGSGDLIYGQPQGSLINHKLRLPQNYIGELSISVLALSQNELDETDFTQGKDLVLLDDIKLYEENNNKISLLKEGYSIFPNPTSDLLRIANIDNTKVFDVQVYDVVGQTVLSKFDILNQDWIDMGNLQEGVYLLRLYENEEFITTIKFAKVD